MAPLRTCVQMDQIPLIAPEHRQVQIGQLSTALEDIEMEPMNGLDKQGVAEMRALLLSLGQAGVTILLYSHNSEGIQTLCSSVWEMERGEIHPLQT